MPESLPIQPGNWSSLNTYLADIPLVVNVAAAPYRADPTGVVTSLPAINTAIGNVAALGGGVVYLPPGTYLVDALIRLRSNVILRGSSRGAVTIRATTGVAAAVICALSGDAVTDCGVEDLSINGDYTSSALTINGVRITTGSRVRIKNIIVDNCGDAGILLQTSTVDSEVESCRILNVGLAGPTTGHGISVSGASHRNKIHDNWITGARAMGISIATGGNGSTDCEILGNYIDQSQSPTYECVGVTADCTRTVAANNVCFNSQDNGISMTAARCVVTGNTVDGTVNHGITLGGDYSVASGNTIRNPASAHAGDGLDYGGIWLGATKCIVSGNTINDENAMMSYGFKEVSPADNNVIGANQVTGWTKGRNLIVGVSTKVVGPNRRDMQMNAQGLVTQNFDRGDQASSTLMIGGTAYAMLIGVQPGDLITNIYVDNIVAATAPTLFRGGIYNLAGTTLYTASADQHTLLTSTGTLTVPLTSPWVVPAATYSVYVVLVATAATTLPTLLRGSSNNDAKRIGSNAWPFTNCGTALSDLPATTLTFATTPSSASCYWIGLG